jgi:hypothetical protein
VDLSAVQSEIDTGQGFDARELFRQSGDLEERITHDKRKNEGGPSTSLRSGPQQNIGTGAQPQSGAERPLAI